MPTYEEKINALIPMAWHEAENEVKPLLEKMELRKGPDGHTYNFCLRSQAFHKIMNRMSAEKKLRFLV